MTLSPEPRLRDHGRASPSHGRADRTQTDDRRPIQVGRPRPTHACIDRAADLEKILAPDLNVCVLRRPLSEQRQRLLARAVGNERFEAQEVIPRRAATAERLVAALPEGPARRWLRRDIERLLGHFLRLLPCEAVDASLELVDYDACRKYHRDHVGIRLLCTYFGPGTEWAPAEAVLHRGLADEEMPRNHEGILVDKRRLRRARPGDVVLLKGRAWPGNERNGAVHRSPPVEALGLRRLLLRLDTDHAHHHRRSRESCHV